MIVKRLEGHPGYVLRLTPIVVAPLGRPVRMWEAELVHERTGEPKLYRHNRDCPWRRDIRVAPRTEIGRQQLYEANYGENY